MCGVAVRMPALAGKSENAQRLQQQEDGVSLAVEMLPLETTEPERAASETFIAPEETEQSDSGQTTAAVEPEAEESVPVQSAFPWWIPAGVLVLLGLSGSAALIFHARRKKSCGRDSEV